MLVHYIFRNGDSSMCTNNSNYIITRLCTTLYKTDISIKFTSTKLRTMQHRGNYRIKHELKTHSSLSTIIPALVCLHLASSVLFFIRPAALNVSFLFTIIITVSLIHFVCYTAYLCFCSVWEYASIKYISYLFAFTCTLNLPAHFCYHFSSRIIICTYCYVISQFISASNRNRCCCRNKNKNPRTLRCFFVYCSFAEVEVGLMFLLLVVLWFARDPGFAPGYESLFEEGYVLKKS